jgi:hypothetical protein
MILQVNKLTPGSSSQSLNTDQVNSNTLTADDTAPAQPGSQSLNTDQVNSNAMWPATRGKALRIRGRRKSQSLNTDQVNSNQILSQEFALDAVKKSQSLNTDQVNSNFKLKD